MKLKSIDKILNPPPQHWVGDGFKVHTFFPSSDIDKGRMSPFYLLDYNAKMIVEPSETQRGVGPHPHRGFETVTLAHHGRVAHHDSAGNSGVIKEGDVQWMTAGKGILHKEYHEKEFSQKGGDYQVAQLWVNLPAKFKMTDPKYQALEYDNMGKYQTENGSLVNIIAGEFKGVKGPASTFTPINIYDIRLAVEDEIEIELPKDHNTGIIMFDGSVIINDKNKIKTDQFALFKNDGNTINLNSTEKSSLLVLSGEPINEGIFQYGPFLMNTKSEIIEAIDDFNSGKFGHLE